MKFRGSSSSRRSARPSELLHRLRIAFAVLFATTSVGTTGYMILGLSFVDALYQTVITVSTVGFREVGTADQIDTDYKFFTIVLIMVGAGAVLYTLGVLIETLIEGRLSEEFGRRRMQRTIEDLSNHVIVCGWGQVGQSIAGTLTGEGHDVVVVDRRQKVADEQLHVVGDATDDAMLSAAGIDRARALVVALDTDADNVYVTLSGRAFAERLFIVARANDSDAEDKLYRAGADRVVNPHQLGGAHMAALVSQPNVTEFLDITMNNRELAITISELEVGPASMLARRAIKDLDLAGNTILAIRRADGAFDHHPDLSLPAGVGDVLIALGTSSELSALHEEFDG